MAKSVSLSTIRRPAPAGNSGPADMGAPSSHGQVADAVSWTPSLPAGWTESTRARPLADGCLGSEALDGSADGVPRDRARRPYRSRHAADKITLRSRSHHG